MQDVLIFQEIHHDSFGSPGILRLGIYAGTLTTGGVLGGDLPGDLQENCPPQSKAVPGAVPWMSQGTKLIPGQVPAIPG